MAAVLDYLTHAEYWAMCILYIISFKPQNDAMREIAVIFPEGLAQGSMLPKWTNPIPDFY